MNGYEKLVKEQLLKHGYKLVRTAKVRMRFGRLKKVYLLRSIIAANHGTRPIAS